MSVNGTDRVDWRKLEQAIRRAIDERQALEPEERRARIYAAARRNFGQRPDVDDETMAQFDALAASIETSYASRRDPRLSASARRAVRKNMLRYLPVFALGIAVGVLGCRFAFPTAASPGMEKLQSVGSSYEATRAQVPVAMGFLQEVADAIIKAQKGDRKKLDISTKGFVALAKFDAQLAKKVPSSMPKGSAVMLRADAFNFKVLFNWPLCGTVKIADPDLVDPVRAVPNTVGCPYFGLWTSEAAKW